MTTGEVQLYEHPSTYNEWTRLVRKITGNVTVVSRDFERTWLEPLIHIKRMPIPEPLQQRFGPRISATVTGGEDLGFRVHFLSGLMGLQRHHLSIDPTVEAEEDIHASADVWAYLRERGIPTFSNLGWLATAPNVHRVGNVLLHEVTDPAEAHDYAALLESMAQTATEQGLNRGPREIHPDRPLPLPSNLFE